MDSSGNVVYRTGDGSLSCKVMDSSGNVVYSRTVYLKRSTTLWTNTYNSDGIRVSRTNRESTYDYTYLSGQLTKLTVDGHTMYFNYSASGTPLSMTYNGANYYYVTSLQGDVIALVNSAGTVVTTYLYDAWGNILSTTGTLSTTVGRYNPLRYRGYIYDRETKLYYLQTRYYDPEVGRFINADGYVSTGQGLMGNNMFVYCGNNPILNIDTCGTMYKEDAGGGCGGGCYISVNVGSGGGGGGSVTINTSNWGYTNVVDYAVVSGSVADAAAGIMVAVGSSIAVCTGRLDDLRYEHIQLRCRQTKATSAVGPMVGATVAMGVQLSDMTPIYRHHGINPGNLKPRQKELVTGTGLSFLTVPGPNCGVTTIGAINATGVLVAVRDGASHVSVYPVGGTMVDWYNAGSDSIWTQTLKSILKKWDGA